MTFSHVTSADSAKLKELAGVVAKSQKVVMITGAGISTSCGIPDFRSTEGLYSLMQAAHKGDVSGQHQKVKGADLFNVNLFRDEQQTRSFYRFIAALREKIRATKKTSSTHRLIRKLRDNGKLVRCYTQNIDGFEVREDLCCDLSRGSGSRRRMEKKVLAAAHSPISTSPGGVHDTGCEVVPLHGDLATVRCTVCLHRQQWTTEEQQAFAQGESPVCPECQTQDEVRKCVGKRGIRIGSLRPNIVLYGEDHQCTDTISEIRQNDMRMKPDLLLVMGTSLKVDGLKMLVREFANTVHQKKNGKVVFVNMTPPAASVWGDVFDTWVDMDCDGWVNSMKNHRPEIWQTQSHLDADEPIDLLNLPTVRAHSLPKRYDPVRLGSGLDRKVRVLVECDSAKFEGFKQHQRKRKSVDADLEKNVSLKRRRVSHDTASSEAEPNKENQEKEDDDTADTIVVSPSHTPKKKRIGARLKPTSPSTASRRQPSHVLEERGTATIAITVPRGPSAGDLGSEDKISTLHNRERDPFVVYSDEEMPRRATDVAKAPANPSAQASGTVGLRRPSRPVAIVRSQARLNNLQIQKHEAPAPRQNEKGSGGRVLRVGQGKIMKPRGSGRQASSGAVSRRTGLLEDRFMVTKRVRSGNSHKHQLSADKENIA